MKKNYNNPTTALVAPRRGSVLIIVIIMTLVAALVTGSIMNYGLTEARINRSDMLYSEARLSAEAALNHGMAQLRNRFDRTSQLSAQELYPSANSSVQILPGMLGLMRQTRAVVPATYVRPANFNAFHETPTVIGALLVNGGEPRTVRIDPFTHLAQLGNPGLPTESRVREVRLYSKATVQDRTLGSRTVYARQTLQIIDRSIFQNTVFYSGLLEIFPGANLNLGMGGGPIYGDDIRIGNSPRIHTRIETSGDFRIGRYHNNDNRNDTAFLTDMRLLTDTIPANANSVNYLRDLRFVVSPTTSTDAVQTGRAGFRELALQGFNGGLLTAEHGIVPQAAIGLEFLRELTRREAAAGAFNDAAGNFDQGQYDRLGANFGHLLIAPPRPLANTAAIADANVRQREEAINEIERNKWSNRSSLSIELIPGAVPADDTVRIFHQPLDGLNPRFDATGNRVRTEIPVGTTFPNADTRFWNIERFTQANDANNTVTAGIYDYRQSGNALNADSGRINLVRIDMEKMRSWVEQNWTAAQLGTGGNAPTFNNEWWNGGVYVRLPEVANPNRADRVVPANANWAVQLHTATRLPNRNLVDSNAPRGLTLATNGAMYVQGTYNAPVAPGATNNLTWNAATYGVQAGAEVPAALVADAITLLSSNWNNNSSGSDLGQRTATPTTHSAALVTGNVPSTTTGVYSGGLENFPRYLENWSRRTHTYRGSLIRLFRSETFARNWGGNRVYNAPNRDWSFHSGYRTFAPPLEVGPRVFRRVNFKELTEAQFRAETATLFGAIVR